MASRFSQSSESTSSYREDNGGDSSGQMTALEAEARINGPSDVIGMTYLPQTLFLCDFRHECFEECISGDISESGLESKWRLKERMKTGCVALVLCLNIGVDPPDVIKISPCARMECWIDPFSRSTPKALDEIGKSLHSQYERWQPRARYKLQLDPTIEEVKKLCTSSRRCANTERVLFHYNGHGVPKPTINGEIWVFNKSYTQYIPLPISELDSWLGSPSIYVFDCSAAGIILNDFIEVWNSASAAGLSKDCILLAACESHESLPQSSEFPADLFTSCLTTPLKMALHWLCSQSLLHKSIDYSLIDKIPGRQNDRKTLLGELNWIFTAITDTIAWTVLPHELFQRLFRQDLLVASLFRNFLLAQRVMRSANCSPMSYPPLPSTQQHHMWDAWDMAAEICLSKLPELIYNPTAEYQPSSFFTEQLQAFELWLDNGSEHKKPPEQLPIILQVLLSQSHRYRALVLLGRFLDISPRAVDLALSVGLFPYVLKLLQTMALELRQILVFIWAKILALDKSCQADLVKDGGHIYFIKFLDCVDSFPEQRAMAAFILAVITNGHRPGQEACVRANLIHICFKQVQLASPYEAQTDFLLLQWLCICLGKLWEDYRDAQITNSQDALTVLSPLLSEPQPEVRAAAVFALGALIDTGFDSVKVAKEGENDWKGSTNLDAEFNVVKTLLRAVEDGSPLVRAEVAVALSRFGIGHKKNMKSAVAACWKPCAASVMRAMPSLTIINNAVQILHQESSPSSPINTLLRSEIDGMVRDRDARISTSGPAASTVLMCTSPASDGPSQLSEFSGLQNENFAANGVLHSQSSLLDLVSSQCVLSMAALARDPSPCVADLGRKALATIGIEHTVLKVSNHNGGSVLQGDFFDQSTSVNVAGLSRSFSWLDMHSVHLSKAFRTPPVSPPKDHYLTRFRRVHSFEYRSNQMASQKAGLHNPPSNSSESSEASECSSLLPQSIIYRLSCGHFSRPLLTAFDPDEDVMFRREEREKIALDHISKCHHSSSIKFNNQIASWDTKFETGTKVTILPPFAPIVIAADENERIRVWNYEDATPLNSFESHNSSNCGVSKLCLLNELDDNLLLVASRDGIIRIWKDFIFAGKQKLVTAFSSIKIYKSGVQDLNVVVDWQQQSGYLYASGELSSILIWDLDKEQNVSSFPFFSGRYVSAMSASQVHGGQLAAGFADGWVRIFDVRTPDSSVLEAQVHSQKLGKVIGIGFYPGFYSNKIVSATQGGDIRILDTRMPSDSLKFTAHKGSVTALSVHRHAPIIATGSPRQVVKVYGLDGETLGTAKYHPTLMAQRIGSVTCLAFHPYKTLLAAGAEDSIVSIYADHA